MPDPRIADVLLRHSERLMALPGVVGTAEGRLGESACVVVLVAYRTDALESGLPRELEGVRVVVRQAGEPEAFDRS